MGSTDIGILDSVCACTSHFVVYSCISFFFYFCYAHYVSLHMHRCPGVELAPLEMNNHRWWFSRERRTVMLVNYTGKTKRSDKCQTVRIISKTSTLCPKVLYVTPVNAVIMMN